MKEGRRSRGVAPLLLNLGTRWRSVVNFIPRPLYPRQRTAVPVHCGTGWVWSNRKRENSLAPTGMRTVDRPVAVPSTLYRLLQSIFMNFTWWKSGDYFPVEQCFLTLTTAHSRGSQVSCRAHIKRE